MLNPVHKLKKFVRYTGNEKPDASYVTEVSGWLASGKLDANGKEIFEGDRVKLLEHGMHMAKGRVVTVTFEHGIFLADGEEPLEHFFGALEIIGHIADED